MIRLLTFIALVISTTGFSQDFSGRITYKTKMLLKNIDFKSSVGNDSRITPEMMKQIEGSLKKSTEKTYFLEFTKNESSYQEEKKLEQPTSNNIMISHMNSGSGNLYKNIKENYSVLETDYMGKEFRVKNTLDNSDWQLSSESKKIGNYTVYKATKTVKALETTSINELKKDLSTDLLSNIETTPKDVEFIAWYTPEIAVANGPDQFGGLPGLILELHTPTTMYLCSEVVLNPSKKVTIKEPKGKTISQEEYAKIMMERTKEMIRSSKLESKNGTIIIGTNQ